MFIFDPFFYIVVNLAETDLEKQFFNDFMKFKTDRIDATSYVEFVQSKVPYATVTGSISNGIRIKFRDPASFTLFKLTYSHI